MSLESKIENLTAVMTRVAEALEAIGVSTHKASSIGEAEDERLLTGCGTTEPKGEVKPKAETKSKPKAETKSEPKAEPKAETKPEPKPKSATMSVTIEDVKEELLNAARRGRKDEAKALLSNYGATKIGQLKESDYEAVIEAAKEL